MSRIITFGTFDMFHLGHLSILQRARSLGSFLSVGVSTDELNLSKKGFFPLFSLEERMSILKELRCVDKVFPEEELELKRQYVLSERADILVMGDDWSGRFDELSDLCKVVYLPRTPDISSTLLKERVKNPY